jgi:hypothetical protein
MAARQSANAEAENAERNAMYQEAIMKLEADKEAAEIARQEKAAGDAAFNARYSAFMSNIPEGATAEEIDALALAYGISPYSGEVKNLKDYVTKYGDNTSTANDGNELPTDTYNPDGTLNMDLDEAKEYREAIKTDSNISAEDKEKFEAAYIATFESKKKTINMYAEGFSPRDIGYAGSNNKSSEQYKYIYALKEAAENGKLQEGDYVNFNYGAEFMGATIYKYKGNGVFEKVTGAEKLQAKVYVPNGYVGSGNYAIVKKK